MTQKQEISSMIHNSLLNHIAGAERLTQSGAQLDNELRKQLKETKHRQGDGTIQSEYLKHFYKEIKDIVQKAEFSE